MLSGHLEAVRVLLGAGADPAYLGCVSEDTGMSVEQAAVAGTRCGADGAEILALVSGAMAFAYQPPARRGAGGSCNGSGGDDGRRRHVGRERGRSCAPRAADDAVWVPREDNGKRFVYNEATGQVAWEAPTAQWTAFASQSRKH